MATRSHTSFKKRQKEMARLEKRQDKATKKLQRKQDKEAGITPPDDDDNPFDFAGADSGDDAAGDSPIAAESPR
ncbi:MAG: hypothetical protein HZB13_15905 [Acidobacteria bacterium]|nr:hypothetical protein [Acidobacteriota bacterium]